MSISYVPTICHHSASEILPATPSTTCTRAANHHFYYKCHDTHGAEASDPDVAIACLVLRWQRRALLGGAGAAGGLLLAYGGDANRLHFDAAGAAQGALRLLDSETAHNAALQAAKLGLTPRELRPDPPILGSTVWGRHFSNPIGARAACLASAACVKSHCPHRSCTCLQAIQYTVLWRPWNEHAVARTCTARAPDVRQPHAQGWQLALTRMQKRWRACWAWALGLWRSVGAGAVYRSWIKGLHLFPSNSHCYVPTGSVTPLPQPGNDKPRAFRLPELG